jgi:murein DD-endopeptidase MepM/ murein hydrolase activator NlpD
MKIIFSLFIYAFLPFMAMAAEISISPLSPIQGEPVLITIHATSSVKEAYFGTKKLKPFPYDNSTVALYGIDLRQKTGPYVLKVFFADGSKLEQEVVVSERKKIEAPLSIPAKLGGDTATSAAKLVDTLAQENASLLNLRTGTHSFWKEPFRYPVLNPVVTDTYGYLRQTVGYSIAHKGTDFRAPTGTKVMAINRGVVRVAKEGRNYGKTIVVDHGLGLQSFYMHLSKIYVKEGELVLPGEVIGLSGMTGYAESPHLHLTIRIHDVSIDPMVFFKLWGSNY